MQEVWTPPEKLDPNVQRMAWLMFLECWKSESKDIGVGKFQEWVEDVYGEALLAAKIIRAKELEAGGA